MRGFMQVHKRHTLVSLTEKYRMVLNLVHVNLGLFMILSHVYHLLREKLAIFQVGK